jgi:uracil-DNA glycosylase
MQQEHFDGFSAAAEGLSPRDWPPTLRSLKPIWAKVVGDFFRSESGVLLRVALQNELDAGRVIYPPHPLRLLQELSPSEVRVVILGQDPYHGPGQAEGLSFSVAHGVKAPPSLVNVFKELKRDLGQEPPAPLRASLMPWVKKGVFLLNQTLTVRAASAASHAQLPWSVLTKMILEEVMKSPSPTVVMLWGAHAQKSEEDLKLWSKVYQKEVLILSANHPSPLSALRGEQPFIGCGHFGQAKRWLAEKGLSLDWGLE